MHLIFIIGSLTRRGPSTCPSAADLRRQRRMWKERTSQVRGERSRPRGRHRLRVREGLRCEDPCPPGERRHFNSRPRAAMTLEWFRMRTGRHCPSSVTQRSVVQWAGFNIRGDGDCSSSQSSVQSAGWFVLVGPQELVAGALRSGPCSPSLRQVAGLGVAAGSSVGQHGKSENKPDPKHPSTKCWAMLSGLPLFPGLMV